MTDPHLPRLFTQTLPSLKGPGPLLPLSPIPIHTTGTTICVYLSHGCPPNMSLTSAGAQ